MHDDMLERFVRDYIESVTGDEVVFSWQGGEPTLMGLDFFRKVVALQRKYAKAGQRIENDLQTNGTLLDEDWASVPQAAPLPGRACRIDGPNEIHDRYRVTKQGEPTFDAVYGGGEDAEAHRRTVQHAHLREPLQCLAAARRLPLPAPRTGLDLPAVHPDRRAARFETTAPQNWDPRALPVVGSPRPGRTIRFRSSRRGRSTPRNTATSCRRCGTSGSRGMSARC